MNLYFFAMCYIRYRCKDWCCFDKPSNANSEKKANNICEGSKNRDNYNNDKQKNKISNKNKVGNNQSKTLSSSVPTPVKKGS